MMRTEDEACAFALKKVPQSFYLVQRCFLLGNHVVQPEHHEGVGVCENPFVDRQSLSGLINSLINSDGLSGDLADEVLEAHKRQVKQLERASNALKKHLLRVFDGLIVWPSHPPNLGHSREAVIQLT